MAASSITGRGRGNASPVKGPGNNRNFFVPVVSPHIIMAGSVTLSGSTTATVTLPSALAHGADEYVVMLTNTVSDGGFVSSVVNNGDGKMTSFEVTATDGDTVNYLIVNKGHGLEV